MQVSAPGSNSYTALAYHESLEQGRCTGTLQVSHDSLSFIWEEQILLVLPMSGVELKLGGNDGRVVYVSHADHPEWTVFVTNHGLLSNPILLQRKVVAAKVKSLKRKHTVSWSVFIGMVTVILLMPMLLLLNLDVLAGVVARQVPAAWEERLGRDNFEEFKVQHSMLEGAETLTSLGLLTDVLVAHSPSHRYPFRFHIVAEDSLNAFALPGGYIVIHSGLILAADNADELLGVMAHEMAHVSEQHGLRSVISSLGVWLTVAAVFGDASGLMAAVAAAGPMLLTLRYSRDFEEEADREGFELLSRAGVNPQGLVSFFEKLIAEEAALKAQRKHQEGEESEDSLEYLSGFLSTHPATEDRVEHIQQLAASQQKRYRNFEAAFIRLKSSVQGSNPTPVNP